MGRITETRRRCHCYYGNSTLLKKHMLMDVRTVNLALMGLRLRKYIALTVRLHIAGEV